MSATSAALTWPSLSLSMTLNDSRMLCNMGGGILDSPSLEVPRVSVAGRDAGRGAGLAAGFSVERSTGFSTGLSLNASLSTEAILSKEVAFLKERGGGVSECDWSNLAAMDAVLSGRTVAWVDEEPLRVGEGTGEGMFRLGDAGASRAVAVARVFSHEGGFCDALPAAGWRRFSCEGVVGVSFGLRGELVGVVGFAVDGDASRMEPGRRKGDWRGLLKDSGEGLYGVGVVDWMGG